MKIECSNIDCRKHGKKIDAKVGVMNDGHEVYFCPYCKTRWNRVGVDRLVALQTGILN